MKKLTCNRGLTLTEFLVVIIVLALLASFVVPVWNTFTDGASKSACLANQRRLDSATDLWYAHDKANLKKEPTVNELVRAGCITADVGCPGAGSYRYNKTTNKFECSDKNHSRSR